MKITKKLFPVSTILYINVFLTRFFFFLLQVSCKLHSTSIAALYRKSNIEKSSKLNSPGESL